MTQAGFPLVNANHAPPWPSTVMGNGRLGSTPAGRGHAMRRLSLVQRPSHIEFNDWSVAMQTGGQVECNSPHEPARSPKNSKKKAPFERLKPP
jgi:hypothetical protein